MAARVAPGAPGAGGAAGKPAPAFRRPTRPDRADCCGGGFRGGTDRFIVEGRQSARRTRNPMTRRYDVRTGAMENDPDAGRPREQLVPGWRVPRHTRYDYDLRIGDAERDAAMAQLREHFVAGRLTFDELTERIDAALVAKTQRQIDL